MPSQARLAARYSSAAPISHSDWVLNFIIPQPASCASAGAPAGEAEVTAAGRIDSGVMVVSTRLLKH